MISIQKEKIVTDEQLVNSLIYKESPFTRDVSRRHLVRLVMMRVILYRELASKTSHKPILSPFVDLPNLQTDLLPHERGFYQCALLGSDSQLAVQDDILSHFVCRMAFCQNEGLRDYMVKNQCIIFRNKLQSRTDSDFLVRLHQKVSEVSGRVQAVNQKEFAAIKTQVNACKLFGKIEDRQNLIKMPFQMASEAFRQREAFLKSGYAYFDKSSLVRIIINCFEDHLRRSLQEITQNVQEFMLSDKEDQLCSFLKQMGSLNLHHDYSYEKMQGKLTAKNTQFWSRCFPPCMSNLYNQLRTKHHLKHNGRLHLTLFLKGAGLPLDQALIFWKNMFQGSGKNFQKQYLYNVKHSYGKEGAKKNYSPMGCEMIIRNSDPKAGEYHGCPFKNCGPSDLKQLIRQNYRLTDQQYQEIEQLYAKKHYQPACQLLFKYSHSGISDTKVNRIGTHPNLYFEQSMKYVEQKAKQAQAEKNII